MVRRFVDLHTHSTASDGTCTPEEVVRLADAAGLAAVALADHDTTSGLAPARRAAAALPLLRFVNAIEISAKYTGGSMHIVGLGIDEAAPGVKRIAERLRRARNERNPKMLVKLQALGLAITMEDVLAEIGETPATEAERIVGRMHFAQALCRKGCVRGTAEAFERYLGDHAPAFVDKERIDPPDAVRAIRDSGGVAVLAHPSHLRCENRAQLERVVRGLMRHGLNAIEVHHTDHTPEQTRTFLDLARALELGVSGGSDYHGSAKTDAALGHPRVPVSILTGEMAALLADGR